MLKQQLTELIAQGKQYAYTTSMQDLETCLNNNQVTETVQQATEHFEYTHPFSGERNIIYNLVIELGKL